MNKYEQMVDRLRYQEEQLKRFENEKCELLGIIQGKDKLITGLKAQIEKMKCCENCRHHRFYGDTLTCKLVDCNNYEKWEAHSH